MAKKAEALSALPEALSNALETNDRNGMWDLGVR